MTWTKKPATIAIGALCLFGGVGLFFKHEPQPSPVVQAKPVEPRNSPQKIHKTITRDELLQHRDKPADLMADLDSILGTPLETDPKVIEAYIVALDSLSPTDLSELLIKYQEMNQYVIRNLAGQKDARRLGAVIEALRVASSTEEQKQIEVNVLHAIAQDADYFGPDHVNDSLGLLKLKDEDMKAIANGLVEKVWNDPDPKNKAETIDSFLQNLRDPILLDRIVGARVEDMSFKEGEDWLLHVDPSVAGKGDGELMRRAMREGDPSLGSNYVNKLMDAGQNERATKAAERLVDWYSRQDPKASMNWVASIPAEIRSPQMVTTAFSLLYQRNPAEARELIASLDPALKAKCEATAKVIDAK